ncbi:MAG: Gfo/Idh/MocA family oxidoreductase [Henriciella sp.]
MPSPLRIGILGAARIAPKAVCDPARVLSLVEVTAVAARNRARAETFAADNKIRTVLDSYDALIESPDVDMVYNPLPINLHAEWTIKALEAGKHVLCEKPFAMNSDEAKAMVAASGKSGKRLIEAFHYRYHPAFRQCLAWIEEGRIGDIQSIDTEFSVAIRDSDDEIRQLPETGGGAMMDLGCYPLHWVLNMLEDEPASISAKAVRTKRGVDESMMAMLSYASGAQVNISTSMAEGQPFRASLNVHGSKGKILFQNPLAPHAGGSLRLIETATGEKVDAEISPITTYTWQLGLISLAVNSGADLPTEGPIILRQQKLLDDIYEAAGLRDLRYR